MTQPTINDALAPDDLLGFKALIDHLVETAKPIPDPVIVRTRQGDFLWSRADVIVTRALGEGTLYRMAPDPLIVRGGGMRLLVPIDDFIGFTEAPRVPGGLFR